MKLNIGKLLKPLIALAATAIAQAAVDKAGEALAKRRQPKA